MLHIENTFIYLIGFAGTGKLTIAQKLASEINAKIVDNHLINNPVFSVLKTNNSKLPDEVWNKTAAIRDIVLDTIKTLSAPELNFIFTNELIASNEIDEMIYNQIKALSETKGSNFFPISLTCSLEELSKRVTNEERKINFKDTNIERTIQKYTTSNVFVAPHPNSLTIDVSTMTPSEVARNILIHITQSTRKIL